MNSDERQEPRFTRRLIEGRLSRREALGGAAALPLTMLLPSISYRAAGASSAKEELRFTAVGGVFDGSGTGEGTNNSTALGAFFRAAASGRYRRLIFDAPRHGAIVSFASPVGMTSPNLTELIIDLEGSELVCSDPFARPRTSFFRIDAPGGKFLILRNGTIGLGRPGIRTPHSDMVLLQEFESILVENLSIPCADNMGLTIQRNFRTRVPDEVVLRGVSIGGRVFERPHSHASVGDTGIWMPYGAKSLQLQADVQSCGDDGIFFGPVPVRDGAPLVRTSGMLTARVRRTGSAGIKVANPNVAISGSIDTTNGPALQLVPGLFGAQGYSVDNCRVQVDIVRGGQFEPDAHARTMIPKSKAGGSGIWIYGQATNVDLGRSTMSQLRYGAVLLQAREGTTISGLTGDLHVADLCTDAKGQPFFAGNDVAVLKRSATGSGSVRNCNLTFAVKRANCPMVFWGIAGAEDDRDVRLTYQVSDSAVRSGPGWWPGRHPFRWHSKGRGGRLSSFTVTVDWEGGPTGRASAFSGNADMSGIRLLR